MDKQFHLRKANSLKGESVCLSKVSLLGNTYDLNGPSGVFGGGKVKQEV